MKRLYLSVILLFSFSISHALDFGELKTLSRAIARDPIPTNGSPRIAEIYVSTYVNIGMQEICSNTWCLETSTTIPVRNGVREYSLPNDNISIRRVLLDGNLINSTSISKKDVENSNWTANLTTNTPTAYYEDTKRNLIGFDSFPVYGTDKIIKVSYVKQPQIMTNASDMPFDNNYRLTQYQFTICLFTASMICYQDNRATEGDRFYAMYVDRVKNMAASIGLSGDYYPSFSGNGNAK